MITDTNLSVDNKPVKWMTINGRLVYTTEPDYTYSTYELMAQDLSGATTAQGSYTPPGDTEAYTYTNYTTNAIYQRGQDISMMAKFGLTCGPLVRISDKCWTYARHYNVDPPANFSFGPGYFTKQEHIGLKEWAEQNELPLPNCNIDDVGIAYYTYAGGETYWPSYIPYLMTWGQFQSKFHKDSPAGVPLWGFSNKMGSPYIYPAITNNETSDGKLRWSTPNKINAVLPELIPEGEQYDIIRNLNPTYLGQTGDSGFPVYIQLGANRVLISDCWQIYKPAFSPTAPYYMCGPNYFKAFDLLKAYIESKGDTIKTLED